MSVLRSRSKGEEDGIRWPVETMPNTWLTSNSARKTVRPRVRVTKWRCVGIAILLIVFWGYMHNRTSQRELENGLESANLHGNNQTHNGKGHAGENQANAQELSPGESRRSAKWKYPMVDRTILEKLERMEEFYAPEYYKLDSSSTTTEDPTRWPPKVLRVPERGGSRQAPMTKGDQQEAICESPKHPRPCRFLLPLRISEQESKARIHLAQIAQLARALNRTLVLPNVGKSKIGACFKWELGTYYDVSTLLSGGIQDNFVGQERFRGWLNGHQQGAVKSQLISIGPGVPAHTRFRQEPVHSNSEVSALAYHSYGAWERNLPGCFDNKLERLALEIMPMYMSTTNVMNKDGSTRYIGDSVIQAFSAVSSRATSVQQDIADHDLPLESDSLIHGPQMRPEPEVLVVNWDLRHPIFPPSQNSVEYSKKMHDLAEIHVPKTPYMVVQWRMETVNPELLEDCAYALIDVISRVLHDNTLAENVTTVWFASDYPYPITKQSASQRRPAVITKSGTFKDFEVRHEEAIDILRKAFVKEGELSSWELTDFTEGIESEKGSSSELLQDAGVLGILDKLVSIKANLFISGASRCSRRSSFTKQVVEARNEEWSRARGSNLRNVVEIFG